jgi:hypothetical protein
MADASFFDSAGGACCAEATEEQKTTADRTAILFMALLLIRIISISETYRQSPGQIGDYYRAGGARGEVARGRSRKTAKILVQAASRLTIGTMAMRGDCEATAEPAVEQTGQM